jgi:hypothetical protein
MKAPSSPFGWHSAACGVPVTETNTFQPVCALLTANGYSADEAAEIVLLARKSASPDRWIKVLAGAAVERLRYRQALALAFPASR